MARKAVMTTAGSIAHGVGSAISGGAFTITSTPSAKDFAGGAAVYRGTLAWTFAGGSAAGCVPGTVTGSGTISVTATKSKADGALVVRLDDTGTGDFVGTSASPPPPTIPFLSQPVKVSTAGQSKALGE
jgi:hypothetical protein